MNYRLFLATVGALFLGGAAAAELNWATDYDTALKQAKEEGKLILVDFTGSDWCGWCIKLKAEVFDTPEFAAFANANLVLLEVDFPHRKILSAEQQAANEKLATRFGVKGFPTVFVLNSEGRPLAQTGYQAGGARAYINAIQQIPNVTWKGSAAATDSLRPPGPKGPAPSPESLWAGITAPPKRYDDLKLTGLSGPATRRFAIINNQTFASGETARVKLKDGEVKVVCKEIRAKSVLVQMEGVAEARELFLNTN